MHSGYTRCGKGSVKKISDKICKEFAARHNCLEAHSIDEIRCVLEDAISIPELIASRESKSAVPSGKESNNMLRKYAGSDFSIRTRQHMKEGWRHCFKWMEKELTKRGIAE